MEKYVESLQISLESTRLCIVVIAVVIAAITDVKSFKVYNVLTFPFLVSGIVYHSFFSGGENFLFAFAGALLGFGILILFFVRGGVGAGDVKLLSGIGAWIGPHDVLVVFIVAGLLTGFYSISVIVYTGSWKTVPSQLLTFFWRDRKSKKSVVDSETLEQISNQDRQTQKRKLIPMALMIAIAVLILLVSQMIRDSRSDSALRFNVSLFTVDSRSFSQ